jgi:hypothetical protein
MSVENLRDTIIAKSDQLNADDLIGGSMTITVAEVKRGDSQEQPIVVRYQNDNGRPYKPCKTVRKILIAAWGANGAAWVGRSMTLYNDLTVKWGGVAVGGIRVSHLSDIERDLSVSLAETKGKKKTFLVKKLQSADTELDRAGMYLTDCAANGSQALRAAWSQIPAPLKPKLKSLLDALKPHAEKVDAQNAPAQGFTPAPERVAVVEPTPPAAEEPPPITEEF